MGAQTGSMTWRRPLSLALFALGAILLLGAAALVASAYVAPAEGLQDLGRFVGALLLAGAASVPFAIALVLARDAPRWLVVAATLGCLVALLPALALLTAGVTGSTLFGALFLAAALVGLAGAWRAWPRGRRTA